MRVTVRVCGSTTVTCTHSHTHTLMDTDKPSYIHSCMCDQMRACTRGRRHSHMLACTHACTTEHARRLDHKVFSSVVYVHARLVCEPGPTHPKPPTCCWAPRARSPRERQGQLRLRLERGMGCPSHCSATARPRPDAHLRAAAAQAAARERLGRSSSAAWVAPATARPQPGHIPATGLGSGCRRPRSRARHE
jgi:hypothetical protein